ncbi:hypothetical protein C1D09_016665 [Mesorhizobium intechi]|uniref:hypothetical protein n=1 Tax=Mesorhizobium intechi TaxID=537601 RepID=UPI000CAD6306|nr:hypothetical protein [Mesorhizobium intechi]TSE08974.1 hypothetical protein C1D09_016665 [Mesorhizobium intechi]
MSGGFRRRRACHGIDPVIGDEIRADVMGERVLSVEYRNMFGAARLATSAALGFSGLIRGSSGM